MNHPHICALYDMGSHDGVDYLVMEHIEGETLADRLRKSALPLEQALSRAAEIADALDKAHRKGVVYWDLKPGNVMLAEPGTKLLDVGLAKLAQPAEPVWAGDGSELFYRNNEQMMVVAVELGAELRLGEPRVLFQGAFAFGEGSLRYYDVSPDGERFSMIQSGDTSGLTTIHVVLNLFDELERVFSSN